ncbi:MAG: VWA domain-containing protein [Thermoanaerobaculia bacterium]
MRLVVAVLLLAVPVFAQRYDDSITVNVVEVPVYVERFLKPIPGLTRDDFELFIDGKLQAVEYLDVIEDKAGGPAQEAAPAPADQADLKRRRLVVLLFDVGGSSALAVSRARTQAMQFVQGSRPGDAYAVATIGRTGVQFVVPFTADRIAVHRAIGTMAPSRAGDPFRVATLGSERASWGAVADPSLAAEIPGATPGATSRGLADTSETGLNEVWNGEPQGGFVSSAAREAAQDFFHLQKNAEREERFIGDELFIEELVGLADRLGSLEGVKRVVLLSERRGAQEMAERYGDLAAIVHQRYRAAGVILDGVDIRLPWAPVGDTDLRLAPGASPEPSVSGFLSDLALDTGGTVTASLRDLERRNSITYVLGFRPPEHLGGGTHSIRVRLKNAPLLTEVRHRRSFTLISGRRGDEALFLADTILNDIPQRGVTVDLDVQGTTVSARIPGAELLAHPAHPPLLLDVFSYVFGEKGDAVAWSHMRLRVDLAKGREFLEAHPYTVRQNFSLRPGRYAAKALVRILGTDILGFQRADFVVE